MEKRKIRDSNFELLRIICMLMIVTLHYMGKGGVLGNTQPSEANFIISHLAEALSIVAVNCYMLISGYFMITSKFRFEKLLTLWLQILFYSVGIYAVLLAMGFEHFSIFTLITVSFPVLLKEYWFVSGYIALFLLSPFLNTAIKAFDKRQLEKLIIMLFFLLVLWGNTVSQVSLFVNNGYSLTQFILLYIIAAYIRLHWELKINKYIYLSGYLICSFAIGMVSIPLFNIGQIGWWSSYFLDYSFVGVFIASLCLFMFMREVKINSAFINRIAPLTLSVYLIHEHPVLRPYIYSNILHASNYYHSNLFALHALVSVLSIFAVSVCIDAVRKFLFDGITLLIKNLRISIKEPLEDIV
jgi:surface polysaccharide O-acyltransferase-like enzyme